MVRIGRHVFKFVSKLVLNCQRRKISPTNQIASANSNSPNGRYLEEQLDEHWSTLPKFVVSLLPEVNVYKSGCKKIRTTLLNPLYFFGLSLPYVSLSAG